MPEDELPVFDRMTLKSDEYQLLNVSEMPRLFGRSGR